MSETPDQTQQIIEDDPIAVRRAKREALIAAGKDPYGHAFRYSHHLTSWPSATPILTTARPRKTPSRWPVV